MANGSMEAKGFFPALFDFSFTSFITLKFLKVIYAIIVCVVLLAGLVFLVAGLSQGGGTAVASIIFAPLFTLLYLVFTRISMEVIAIFFRIGENTTIMAANLTGQAPPPPTPGYGSYPPPSPGPAPGPAPGTGYGAAPTIVPDPPTS